MRAETAVKSVKRILSDNLGPSGTLDTDKVAASLLNYRNTPDRDTSLSPAQILFARHLKDTIPTNPANLKLHPEWILTAEARETALARRHLAKETDLQSHARQLRPLKVGKVVQVQNQRGNNPQKWDCSGVIVEDLGFDTYNVRMDGTGRVTRRNRRYLKPIVPFNHQLDINLPLQTFSNELVRNTPANANNNDNTGPTAVSREATTPVTPSQHHSQPTSQPTTAAKSYPDTLPQCKPMSDADFDKGLLKAAKNLGIDPQQKEGTGLEATRSKRVKFQAKRYIHEY